MDFRTLRYGIEIETVGRTREQVAYAIASVTGGQVRRSGGMYDTYEVVEPSGRTWKAMADSSLSNVGRDLQAEVVSPILTYDDMPRLQEIVRSVRGCGAKVDEKCGIHIHVDASAFDGRTLANLAKLAYQQEPLIFTALGIQERRLQTYTKPVSPEFVRQVGTLRPRTKDELNRIWYGQQNTAPAHYDQTRYHGVNLHSVWYRGTVEFRWFEATLHAGKVKAYVQFVLALAAKALRSRSVSGHRRTFTADSAKYDFRVFLLRLGFIGDEFKTARLHLLANMGGDAAFKRGRPAAAEEAASA